MLFNILHRRLHTHERTYLLAIKCVCVGGGRFAILFLGSLTLVKISKPLNLRKAC